MKEWVLVGRLRRPISRANCSLAYCQSLLFEVQGRKEAQGTGDIGSSVRFSTALVSQCYSVLITIQVEADDIPGSPRLTYICSIRLSLLASGK